MNKDTLTNWTKRVIETMEWNMKFIREKSRRCYEEMNYFMKDVIDFWETVCVFGKTFDDLEEAFESPDNIEDMKAMPWFVTNVLFPLVGSISVNLQMGNPLGCLTELRRALELLGRCYFAKTLKEVKVDISDTKWKYVSELMKDLDKELRISGKAKDLWSRLSKEWVHAPGIAEKFIKTFKKGYIPFWFFILPAKYTEEDINILKDVADCISQFREIMKVVKIKLSSTVDY